MLHEQHDLRTYFIDLFKIKFKNSSFTERIEQLLIFKPPLIIIDYGGLLIYRLKFINLNFKYYGVYDKELKIESLNFIDYFVIILFIDSEDKKHFYKNFSIQKDFAWFLSEEEILNINKDVKWDIEPVIMINKP